MYNSNYKFEQLAQLNNINERMLMKTSPRTPQWAIDLTEEVCKDYNRTLPGELKWKIATRESSSGRTMYAKGKAGKQLFVRKKTGRVVAFRGSVGVVAGSSEKDAKLVLLHELAHWVCTRGKSMGHTVVFWKKAFELYKRYGVDMEYAFSREKDYKSTAVSVYERYYKEEA